MRWFFTTIKILFYIPLRIIFPVKVIGKKNLPKGITYITISNHLNAVDVILLGLYLPGFRYFLGKKELGKNKIVRFFLKMLGIIFIDRQGIGLSGIKASINCLKKAPLAIFPEGTRNRINEEVQEIKGGAAMIAVKAGVDMYPVMIHHKTKAFRRNYLFVCPKIELPYTKNDKFNAEALQKCTEIISERMNYYKNFLDKLVSERTYKQYDKKMKEIYNREKQQKEL